VTLGVQQQKCYHMDPEEWRTYLRDSKLNAVLEKIWHAIRDRTRRKR
jgi:hypothetical protein